MLPADPLHVVVMGAGSSVAREPVKRRLSFDEAELHDALIYFASHRDFRVHNASSLEDSLSFRVCSTLKKSGYTLFYEDTMNNMWSITPKAQCSLVFLSQEYVSYLLTTDLEACSFCPSVIFVLTDNSLRSSMSQLPSQLLENHRWIDFSTNDHCDIAYVSAQASCITKLYDTIVEVSTLKRCCSLMVNANENYSDELPEPDPRDMPQLLLALAEALQAVDEALSFACYKLATETLLPAAQFQFGMCYYKGTGTEQEYSCALHWFNEASTQAYYPAWSVLGDCYMYGRGVSKDIVLALEYYKLASEQGDAHSIYSLAEYGVQQTGYTSSSLTSFRTAASKSYAPAQHALGVCYQHGYGVSIDLPLAFMWYQRAALAGHIPAMCALGKAYLYGCLHHEDYRASDTCVAKGLLWLRNGAHVGDAKCMHELALYYSEQPQYSCITQAIQFCTLAAKEHYPPAQFTLGQWYIRGLVILRDEKKGFSLIKRAATANLSDAQFFIGKCYMTGTGVAADPKLGRVWLRRAAHAGCVEALHMLGEHAIPTSESPPITPNKIVKCFTNESVGTEDSLGMTDIGNIAENIVK